MPCDEAGDDLIADLLVAQKLLRLRVARLDQERQDVARLAQTLGRFFAIVRLNALEQRATIADQAVRQVVEQPHCTVETRRFRRVPQLVERNEVLSYREEEGERGEKLRENRER